MPNSIDPNQPLTISTLWPWILAAMGAVSALIRAIIKRLLKIEIEVPIKEIRQSIKLLQEEHFKIRDSLNEIKIQNARLEEAVENLKRTEH